LPIVVPATNRSLPMGLTLPARLDPAKPLVVVLHGYNAGQWHVWDLMDAIEGGGHQIAPFCYAIHTEIPNIARDLARDLGKLRQAHPGVRISFVTHSMGGLVAREYVESDLYGNDTDRLILIGPPNHGTPVAHFAFMADWRSAWAARGTTRPDDDYDQGKASEDLLPGSKFLKRLNERPRREGVKYTIVAGNRHQATTWMADLIDPDDTKPSRWKKWWGIRQMRDVANSWAERMRKKEFESDGLVTLDSARLEGVTDFVVIGADHTGLVWRDGTKPPPAWEIIKDRLSRSGAN
jgi:pimeloyl-ACP methyl ester carboxylesterase